MAVHALSMVAIRAPIRRNIVERSR
jgi:hypothetical protein